MMDRADFFYKGFIRNFAAEPTPCQDALFHNVASFITGDDTDVLVVNGYAGTGKTTALSAVINSLREVGVKSVLMAPTGRAAKVFSKISGRAAATVHKSIYRQKSVGADGFGQFSLLPNKNKSTLFVVDEVSLIGVDSTDRQSTALFGTGNLLEDLIDFVRSGEDCRLILVGDNAQLPPIGLDESPALSREYMDSFGGVMYSELKTVVRQTVESGILGNATMLRNLITDVNTYGSFDDVRFSLAPDVERITGAELIETLTDAYSRYGEDEVTILCRSNKRAIRYNLGVRSTVQFKEEELVRGDKLMVVKNCYQFCQDLEGLDYIANGDVVRLERISNYKEMFGLHFADATLSLPDYDDQEIRAKVCLDTLNSEAASLTYEQQNALYHGIDDKYSDIKNKSKRYSAVREDPYYNALQIKYANAITCHKSQGGQWGCVFIDCPFWQEEQSLDDLKWMYTALTRAVEKVYLVSFPDRFFK